ncbi:MAG TPA: hypothetical protein DDZ89_17500 [Clostridiales bacterium]|nr:hypothetical protein [Clostridiales bacterium]
MTDKMNEDIINKIDLKFTIQQSLIERKCLGKATQEVTPRAKINRCLICSSPIPCEQCEGFVNNACFEGKKKPC